MGLDDEENLVTYGTPLVTDDNEDEVPQKKPIPIDQQIVTDARGLRRFHGAFTGGFSAGYFNTAGSKEGWAPQTFISSRSNRAGKSGQQPEDFMDEEDLGAFGIAPRALKVNKDFAVEGSNKTENARKRHHEINEGPIPGLPPLKDLIVPVSDSMGVQLLRKMGWKPGQGIGPRISIKEKQRKSKPKVSPDVKLYGCSRPDDIDEEDSDADDLKGILFAPDDIDIHGIKAKENWHGLGYIGLDTNPVLSTFSEGYRRELPVVDKSRKLAISGEAFGVGAYEEEDANIYSVDDMSQYDFELGIEPSSSSDKSHKSAHQQAIGYIGKELEGFHLSSKPVAPKKRFPPPALPKNFQPFHKSTNAKMSHEEKQQSGGLDRHKMNAWDREAIIDDEPPAEGSVFKHLKPEDRLRLQALRKSTEIPSVKETEAPSKPKETESFWSKFRASSGSSTFKPFAQDEDKQKRYEIYLKLRESKKEDVFVKCQPTTMTEWEKLREQEEFQRSATIYKPLSQSMASRFVSEKQQDVIQSTTGLSSKESVVEKCKEKMETVKREMFEWHPDRLLCRRFNIPNPYPESNLVGILKVKRDKYSIFNFLELPEQSSTTSELPALTESKDSNIESAQPSSIKGKPKNPLGLFSHMQDGDAKFMPPLQFLEAAPESAKSSSEDARPPMDLFKAIFQDTDSEKDSDSDDDEAQEKPTKMPAQEFSLADIIPKFTNPQNSLSLPSHNTKVPTNPTGVFTNIDFDSLNVKTKAMVPETKKLTSVAVRIELPKANSSDSGFYGPALPPTLASTSQSLYNDSTKAYSANGMQISSSTSPKKRSMHKHKHKKIKKKKKHKKAKTTSSNDVSSDEEINLDKEILNSVKKIRKSRH